MWTPLKNSQWPHVRRGAHIVSNIEQTSILEGVLRSLSAMGFLRSSLSMKTSEECLKNAEDCERQAATCGPGSSRDTLLVTAAQWRRMAEVAARAEALACLPGIQSRTREPPGPADKFKLRRFRAAG